MAKHEEMKEVLEAIKTLNHPVRLSILCNLIEKKEMSAGKIVEQEKELASQSQVSQYLNWLKKRGYVQARKEGKHVYYTIASPQIHKLIETMHSIFCKDKNACI